jgi:hypothetical protein
VFLYEPKFPRRARPPGGKKKKTKKAAAEPEVVEVEGEAPQNEGIKEEVITGKAGK